MTKKHDDEEYEDGVTYGDARNRVENTINHCMDYQRYTYFGIMTMIRKYLNHSLDTKKVLELPQHMLMTVSLGIHGVENLDDALQTYELMSKGYFTHATPTLLNAGRKVNQMASCYLLTMGADSLVEIFECARRCAMISQGGGGVGINATILRARGSPIKGFNGIAHGVCHELLGVFNALARYVDQGGLFVCFLFIDFVLPFFFIISVDQRFI
ncbi:MAG: ribonucleotide reductase N-terminal alpha domain-containing protein [Promethearchaeota archaeon]